MTPDRDLLVLVIAVAFAAAFGSGIASLMYFGKREDRDRAEIHRLNAAYENQQHEIEQIKTTHQREIEQIKTTHQREIEQIKTTHQREMEDMKTQIRTLTAIVRSGVSSSGGAPDPNLPSIA